MPAIPRRLRRNRPFRDDVSTLLELEPTVLTSIGSIAAEGLRRDVDRDLLTDQVLRASVAPVSSESIERAVGLVLYLGTRMASESVDASAVVAELGSIASSLDKTDDFETRRAALADAFGFVEAALPKLRADTAVALGSSLVSAAARPVLAAMDDDSVAVGLYVSLHCHDEQGDAKDFGFTATVEQTADLMEVLAAARDQMDRIRRAGSVVIANGLADNGG